MQPLISVIIPVYNDPEGLSATLTSLINQELDTSSYKIIIVDNGSTDETIDIINDFINRYPDLIEILIEDRIQSSYAARNKGILSSDSKIIAFIDSDMTVDPDWLFKIKDKMSNKKNKYMGCAVEIILNNKTIVGLYNKVLGFRVEKRLNLNHYAPTCCLIIKREILDKTGLFDERLVSSGDYEFGNRAWDAGYKQFFAGDIIMKHPARDNLKNLLKKYFRTGRGKFQLGHYYPDKYSYKGNIVLNHLFMNPWGFIKNMYRKRKLHNLSLLQIILFFFIKWFHRSATLTGYYYEKRKYPSI